MARVTSSQWDFGELFPKETGRTVLTVSEITSKVRKLLESNLGLVWVSGEVTNCRLQSSGHTYFTLKDAAAQIQCVLFRTEGAATRHLLADGKKILVRGELTVYEPRGQYQIRVLSVEIQGLGALQAAFEALKQKLQKEGLFEQERKRPIPKYPQKIGLVTSLSGAAIQDVFHVIKRRNPSLEILVAPCQVQGLGAARDVSNAINELNAWSKLQPPREGLDLILVTRGGGSLEDLWAFNEEPVARAIHASDLPVISAIGHEIDFTISDFVADLRAATPSAAAELVTEGVFSSSKFVSQAAEWMRQHTLREIGRRLETLQDFRQRLRRCHPRRRLQDQSLLLDEAETRLLRATRSALRAKSLVSQNAIDRLLRSNPAGIIESLRDRVQSARAQIARQTAQALARDKLRADSAQAKLELLAPERVLARGYSITMDDETGTVVRDASAVKPGQVLRTKLSRGELRSRGL